MDTVTGCRIPREELARVEDRRTVLLTSSIDGPPVTELSIARATIATLRAECSRLAAELEAAKRDRQWTAENAKVYLDEAERDEKLLAEDRDRYKAEVATLRARVAALEAGQRWIPVGERLPPIRVTVLIADGGFADACKAHLRSDGFWQNGEGYFYRVTHWRPLPSPPPEEPAR